MHVYPALPCPSYLPGGSVVASSGDASVTARMPWTPHGGLLWGPGMGWGALSRRWVCKWERVLVLLGVGTALPGPAKGSGGSLAKPRRCIHATVNLRNLMGLMCWFNKKCDSWSHRLGTFTVNFTTATPESELSFCVLARPACPSSPTHSHCPVTSSHGGVAAVPSASPLSCSSLGTAQGSLLSLANNTLNIFLNLKGETLFKWGQRVRPGGSFHNAVELERASTAHLHREPLWLLLLHLWNGAHGSIHLFGWTARSSVLFAPKPASVQPRANPASRTTTACSRPFQTSPKGASVSPVPGRPRISPSSLWTGVTVRFHGKYFKVTRKSSRGLLKGEALFWFTRDARGSERDCQSPRCVMKRSERRKTNFSPTQLPLFPPSELVSFFFPTKQRKRYRCYHKQLCE